MNMRWGSEPSSGRHRIRSIFISVTQAIQYLWSRVVFIVCHPNIKYLTFTLLLDRRGTVDPGNPSASQVVALVKKPEKMSLHCVIIFNQLMCCA